MDIKYNNHTSRVESNSMQFVIAYETDIYIWSIQSLPSQGVFILKDDAFLLFPRVISLELMQVLKKSIFFPMRDFVTFRRDLFLRT